MSSNIIKISLKIQPNAGRNQVIGFDNGVFKIKIAAPPDKGKANKELIEFLSDILGIKKNCVMILKGQTSHNKILAIQGLNQEEVTSTITSQIKKNH